MTEGGRTVLNSKVPHYVRTVAGLSLLVLVFAEGGLALVVVMNSEEQDVNPANVSNWVGLAALAFLYFSVAACGFLGSLYRNSTMTKAFVGCTAFNAVLAVILMVVYFTPSTELSKRLGLGTKGDWTAINKLFLTVCIVLVPLFIVSAYQGYQLLQVRHFVRQGGGAPITVASA